MLVWGEVQVKLGDYTENQAFVFPETSIESGGVRILIHLWKGQFIFNVGVNSRKDESVILLILKVSDTNNFQKEADWFPWGILPIQGLSINLCQYSDRLITQ